MKKQLAVVLALSATLGISSVMPQAAPLKVEAASTPTLTESELRDQAIEHLNEIRKSTGLKPFTTNYNLDTSAFRHAKFLDLNGSHYGTSEVKGLKGFTGERLWNRMNRTGLNYNNYEFDAEATISGKYSYLESIDAFMNTAYQRDILLSIDQPVIGMGNSGTEFVIDMMKHRPEEFIDVAYPYDGQKNVEVTYSGNEVPNPLKQFEVEKTGYVISYKHPEGIWLDTDKTVFSLVDSKGKDVPVYKEEDWNGTSFYFPKDPLKYKETYTVSISWVDQDPKFTGGKTWSFTTKDDPKPKSTMKAKTSDVSWKGRLLINKANEKLYTSKGKVSRKLKKNEVLKIAKTSSSRYTLSNGNYVKKSKNVTYYLGRISSTKGKMTVYTSKGKVYKKYNANLSLKVYSYSNGKFNVGSGRYVKDATNLKYAK